MARQSPASARPPCRLYLITPPQIPDLDAFAGQLEAALDAGDVAALQVRIKPADEAAVRDAVQQLLPIARARDVAVLLNDRPDLARALGCDGVHIGQEDAPLAEARLGTSRVRIYDLTDPTRAVSPALIRVDVGGPWPPARQPQLSPAR